MKLILINKKQEARDTYTFTFKPEERISWQAGQYIYITLPKLNYEDERGDTRHFTFANSPTENNLIQITTRIRSQSGYKKTLNELRIGSSVEGKGPNGLFIFDEKVSQKSKNNIFLAGGIGITPFRSIIKYNIDKSLHSPMHLIYSNSNDEFIFKAELDKWVKENDWLKIDYYNSSEFGHINKLKILELIRNSKLEIRNSTLWVVGPPSFVSAIEDVLEKLGIEEKNIKTEKFTGY